MKDDFYTRDYDLPNENLLKAIVKGLLALVAVITPLALMFV